MQPGKEMLDELNGLSSYMASLNKVNPYAAPEGYFTIAPAAMLQGVLAAGRDRDITLSIAKTNPYQLPEGYFDLLPESVLKLVTEETENTLSFLPKKEIRSAPAGYFDKLPGRILASIQEEENPATKVIPLGNNIWTSVRWAAAAVLVLGLGFGGFKMAQTGKGTTAATASVEQRLAQLPDTAINRYIQQNIDDFDGDMIASVVAKNETAKPVSKDQLTDKEIIDYLNETGWEASL